MIKLSKCPICKKEEWQSMDHIRDKGYWFEREFLYKDEVNFKICKGCGFITYDYQSNEELTRRYNMDKKAFNPNGIVTGNRKNNYHRLFFNEYMFI